MVYHRILNIVPSAIQQVLVSHHLLSFSAFHPVFCFLPSTVHIRNCPWGKFLNLSGLVALRTTYPCGIFFFLMVTVIPSIKRWVFVSSL